MHKKGGAAGAAAGGIAGVILGITGGPPSMAAGGTLGAGEGVGIGSTIAVIGEEVGDEISGSSSQIRLAYKIESIQKEIERIIEQLTPLRAKIDVAEQEVARTKAAYADCKRA